jgi:hypothetical protein
MFPALVVASFVVPSAALPLAGEPASDAGRLLRLESSNSPDRPKIRDVFVSFVPFVVHALRS